MRSDPIIDEVRRARAEYAAQFNFDLQAIGRDLMEKQKNSPNLVSLPPQRPGEVCATADDRPTERAANTHGT